MRNTGTMNVGNAGSDKRYGPGCRVEPLERRALLSGTVADDFQLAPGRDAHHEAIVEDAAGTLFVAGAARDAGGGNHAIVRQGVRQPDGSVAWAATPVVDYQIAPHNTLSGAAGFKDLVVDPGTGDLYAAGHARDAAGVTHWIVAKRSAADGTVSVVDDYRSPGGTSAEARGIARDAAGNLFVVGAGTTKTTVKNSSTTVTHWVVRRLKVGAAAWETVQDFVYKPGVSTHVSDVVAAPSGVYAVGYSDGRWLAQRGADDGGGGLAWATVDDFRADPNFVSQAMGAGVDAAGNVYAVGSARRATGVTVKGQATSVAAWTVRRAGGTGGGWATIDSYRPTENTGSLAHAAQGFGTDAAGNLYAVGYIAGSTTDSARHAVVRSARPDGTGWATLDQWQLSPGKSSFASGFLADRTGALYTAGNAADAAGVRHGIVRQIVRTDGVSTMPSSSSSSSSSTFSSTPIGGTSSSALAGDGEEEPSLAAAVVE